VVPSTVDEYDLPGYRPEVALDQEAVERAIALINASERPVLYVGGGTLKSRASKELLAFAERTTMPVVTTLMAEARFPTRTTSTWACGHARHVQRGDRDPKVRLADLARRALR